MKYPATDKVDGGYLPVYERIAADLGPAARVCELGVWEGESLRLWQQLFPHGEVTGVDSNREATWPEGTRRVVMRQEDPQLPATLGGPFDLIVDDASHVGWKTTLAFGRLWPLLAPGGFYVIEDWMIGLPEFAAHPMHDPWMVKAVEVMIVKLASRNADVDEVTYRYGIAVVHKRRP